MKKTILVIGGTGAQGVPVVKALATDSKYDIRVLTRNASSNDAQQLGSLPGVSMFEGNTYDENTLRQAFKNTDCVFVNTNGFAIGEKCGHLDGKGKVVQFISAQPTSPMAWSVLTSCMYMEALSEFLRPFPDPENPGTMVFTAPLGGGKCPLIYLEDYGAYARWMFDRPAQSNGLELHVATEDISWKNLAYAFTEVTGQKAVYKDVTLDEYFKLGILDPTVKVGHSTDPTDSTLLTYRENFTGFWNTWKDNLTKRDYQLLDTILPTRVKSVKEWMRRTGYNGKPRSLLKDYRDRAAKA